MINPSLSKKVLIKKVKQIIGQDREFTLVSFGRNACVIIIIFFFKVSGIGYPLELCSQASKMRYINIFFYWIIYVTFRNMNCILLKNRSLSSPEVMQNYPDITSI